jgi:hypothetical protein
VGAQSPPSGTSGTASLADILTAIKNLVVALNNAAQSFNNVNGVSTKEAITAPTVVKTSPGRVASVSIVVAGSTTGMLYDSANLNTMRAPLWVIPEAPKTSGEPYVVNLPTDSGLLVVPGTGQSVTVSWS